MQSGKILLVDDNALVRMKTAALLQSAGYQVIESFNGADALRLITDEKPDLVLLDVVLPDIDGVEVCRRMKAAAPVFVVLLSSTQVSSLNQVAGLDAGADGYIARPVSSRELLARVHSMLRIVRAESALRRTKQELEQRVQERTVELVQANEALQNEIRIRRSAEETERRTAERLRVLSRQLIAVQERERRAIARELHDEVGQMLTSSKILLETGLRAGGETLANRASEARDNIGDLLQCVRSLSLDLRPQMLDDLGLIPALGWHFTRLERQTGLRVLFTPPCWTERLSPELETAIFRIVQEALTNVCRHANVEEAEVMLGRDGEFVHLTISDRGKGFKPSQEASNSTGLSAMEERVDLLGGQFAIRSAPDEGTQITICLPLTFSPNESIDPNRSC